MAIGWLSVLQAVPWSDVIRNAPKVAEGARKLWNTVGQRPATAAFTEPAHEPSSVAALEARIAELQGQMKASSELINALAQQNAQLVKRLEALRVWALWLSIATAVSAAAAAAAVFVVLAR